MIPQNVTAFEDLVLLTLAVIFLGTGNDGLLVANAALEVLVSR